MKTNNTRVFFKYLKNGTTVAIAKKVETDEQIATREVKLRHGDTRNKIVGRKYAFKKLMTELMEKHLIENSEVGLLWKQFGSTCKQPNFKLAY
jgi:hypothetical protein